MWNPLLSILPFVKPHYLAWKMLESLEEQLKTIAAHNQTIGYPLIDERVIETLESLAFEIGLKNFGALAARLKRLSVHLKRAQGYQLSADEAMQFELASKKEIPELIDDIHKLVQRSKGHVWFYCALIVLVSVFVIWGIGTSYS